MKLMEKMRQKKLGNKGFTLVELIIVIAIMAILLGIVGTQVVPYLNRAREAKDLQIINSFSTAGVSAYSMNADRFAGSETGTITVYLSTGEVDSPANAQDYWLNTIIELTGYESGNTAAGDVGYDMVSKKGKTITDVSISINFTDGTVVAQGLAGTGAGGSAVLDAVTSYIGKY